MPAGSEGIQIPVSLQVDASNYQSIIADLKGAVNKLAPDSSLFKGATKELHKLEQEADAIALALKQGFENPAQIDRFAQKIRNLGAHIETTAENISKFKFEDLNLDLVSPDELQKLKDLQTAVEAAQDKVNNFQTNKMKELVTQSAEFSATFKELSLDVNTTKYDQALSKANKKMEDLQDQATKTAERVTAAQNNAARLKSSVDARSHAKGIFELRNTKYNEDYFERDSTGKVTRFKKGGRQLLRSQLEDWGLTSEQIKEFEKTTVENLEKFYETIESTIQNKKNIAALDKKNNAAQLELVDAQQEQQDVNDVTISIQNLINVLQQLYNIEDSSNIYHGEYKKQIEDTEELIKAKKEQVEVIKEESQVQQTSTKAREDGANVTQHASNESSQLAEHERDVAAAAREAAASQQHLTNAIRQWFSFREVINLTKHAIKDAVTHIKELDATMTQIAVVTNMTQSDLWDQIGTYSAIAQQYGVTTNGVYQVSQLYYQQGLQTAEVMNLTQETLKMAKIANLDYATSTDYMTVALRGFKLEMSDAQKVTDVYSKLAAISASDTEELAVAMSKTASGAEAVGSSFENTAAMIALMEETTR